MPSRYRLKALCWLVVREPGELRQWPRLSDPTAAATLLPHLLPDDDREHFVAIFLNAQNHYLGHHEVSVGEMTSSLVSPRELYRAALLAGAASLIVAHSHPSGDPTPSREDIKLTRAVQEAGRMLDIRLHDHLIWGNGTGEWVSMAERSLL